MRVVYHSRHRVVDAPAWCEYVESLEELCARSDVLSIHVPLCEDTLHLVGEREIWTMKRGSIIVNTARGKVLDEAAVIRALEDGHVRVFCFFSAVLALPTHWVVGDMRYHLRSILVGVCRSGRVPGRTAGEPSVARVPTNRIVTARWNAHAGYGKEDGSSRNDELEGFPADRVGKGPRTRVEMIRPGSV